MISVIVPVYNCAPVLERSLLCYKAQTSQDFELIAVDDASTDNSVEILHAVAEREQLPIRFLSLPTHSGASAARNYGFAHARGELVCFIDADDLLSPDFFLSFQREYERSGYDICFCNYQILDERNEKSSLRTVKNDFSASDRRSILIHYLMGKTAVCHCAAAYCRSFLQARGITYVVGCLCAEDTEFVCKVLFQAKRLACIQRALYIYVQHTPSVSHAPPDERVLTAYQAMRRVQRAIPVPWRPLFAITKRARIHGFILDWFLQSGVLVPTQYCSSLEMFLCLMVSSVLAADPTEHRRVLWALRAGKIKFA